MTNQLSRDFALGFEQIGFSSRCLLASSIKSVEFLERKSRQTIPVYSYLYRARHGSAFKNNVYHEQCLFLMLLDHPLHNWDKVDVPVGLSAIELSKADQEFI